MNQRKKVGVAKAAAVSMFQTSEPCFLSSPFDKLFSRILLKSRNFPSIQKQQTGELSNFMLESAPFLPTAATVTVRLFLVLCTFLSRQTFKKNPNGRSVNSGESHYKRCT